MKGRTMKKKITYILTTAVIALAAFFVGKNFANQPEQPETKTPELLEMTVENGGLYLEYTDGENYYTHWISSENLENAGLIDTENIIDWNTDGTELAIMTKNGYEWYAYKSADIYQNRAFVPVKK